MRMPVISPAFIGAALMAFYTPAWADDLGEENIGCIWLDATAPELNIDPADQMQRWCDLRPDQPEITCYDFSVDGEWGEVASFPEEFVLGRQEAGNGLCPSVFDRSSSIIRD